VERIKRAGQERYGAKYLGLREHIMTSTTNTTDQPTILTTPAWATKTYQPDDGSHSGEVTVGPVTLNLEQVVHFDGSLEPMYVWMPDEEQILGAQACRDLAAALLAAAEVIEAATS
jgi:hypothetical protein